jgi:hypothetical protein
VSGWNDLFHEMRGAGIDEGTLDRLLRGRILPDDAPPGFSDVASILAAAASPPSREELRMQASHVVAARDAIGRRTRRLRPGPLGLATGLVLIGALLLLPGLAAAHFLPDPAQHAVTTVLEKVGITIPATHPTPQPTPHQTPRRSPSGVHPASTGSEISSIARTTDATGVDKGAEISSVASGGTSQAGQHGQASADHGSSTAGSLGQETAHAASDGHGSAGSSHASANPGGARAHP